MPRRAENEVFGDPSHNSGQNFIFKNSLNKMIKLNSRGKNYVFVSSEHADIAEGNSSSGEFNIQVEEIKVKEESRQQDELTLKTTPQI